MTYAYQLLKGDTIVDADGRYCTIQSIRDDDANGVRHLKFTDGDELPVVLGSKVDAL